MKVFLAIIWFAIGLTILLSITSAIRNAELVSLNETQMNSRPNKVSAGSKSQMKEVSFTKKQINKR